MPKQRGSSTNNKIRCLHCNKEMKSNNENFYTNSNPLFSSEKLEVCKKCIRDFIGDNKNAIGYLDRVKLVLALMNRPLLEDIWLASDGDWNNYIPQISSFHKGKSFADSSITMNGARKKDYEEYSEEQSQVSPEELRHLQLRWGRGFEIDDYLFLENEYETLLTSYECESYAQEMLFHEISHQRLVIKKNREDGKSTEKELKTLQDLLASSNIKPVQETGANAVEQATFGTLIKKFENEDPIPEPSPEWEDVDGIRKYVQVWFLGHLCRMLGIKNEYSKMYEEERAKYNVEAPTYEESEDGEVS